MAEQHQHKNTMGMPFRSPMGNNGPPPSQVNPNRTNMVNSGHSFANDFGQFNSSDFMNNAPPQNAQFELAAKQEMMFSQQQQQHQHHMPIQTKMNPNAFNKQQFPYGSPNTIGIKMIKLS